MLYTPLKLILVTLLFLPASVTASFVATERGHYPSQTHAANDQTTATLQSHRGIADRAAGHSHPPSRQGPAAMNYVSAYSVPRVKAASATDRVASTLLLLAFALAGLGFTYRRPAIDTL